MALLVAFALSGCRSNFEDPTAVDASTNQPDASSIDASRSVPTMAVTIENAAIGVSVPERFDLIFTRNQNWQPSRWSLASYGDVDLSGAGTDAQLSSIMTPLIICASGGCVSPGSMSNPTAEVSETTPRSVVIETAWDWELGGQSLRGTATQEIDIDGNWQVTASVRNDSALPVEGTLEFADTHVAEDLNWTQSTSLANDQFSFSRSEPAARFEVNYPGLDPAETASDEFNNCYFVKPINLAPGQTESVSWTAKMLP